MGPRTLGDKLQSVTDVVLAIIGLAQAALVGAMFGALLGLGVPEFTSLPTVPCVVAGALVCGVGLAALSWFAAGETDG